MADFQMAKHANLNQVSVEDHFDTSHQAENQSAKRLKLNTEETRSATSDNNNNNNNNNIVNDSTDWYKNVRIVDVRSLAPKRKVPARKDNGPSYRMSPNPTKTVCASFHQNSNGQGLSEFRGTQCTSMAFCALLVSTTLPVHMWASRDMDAILRYGDKVHHRFMSNPNQKGNDTTLALNKIPASDTTIYQMPIPNRDSDWFDGQFFSARQSVGVNKSQEYYGRLHTTNEAVAELTDLHDTRMEDALNRILIENYTGALITVDDRTGAIMRDHGGRIRYFDSHSNNKIGRVNPDGTAVLLTFETVRDLVRHIGRNNKNPLCRYEMIGIKAKVLTKIAVCRPIKRQS